MTTDAHNISTRAMLAELTISQWSARRHDKAVSAEVAQQHDSDVAIGKFNKSLVANGALKPVQSAASELRTYHYTNTLPWSDSGPRILPAENYMAYTAGIRERRTAFERAVAAFLVDYDSHVEDARKRLGSLYRASDHPTRAQLERRFACESRFLPLPDADDFRVALGDLEERRIRDQIEARMSETIAAAHRSLWQRCHDAVAHMVERLNAYQRDDEGKVVATFRDSLVENIRELVELLPRLNLTGDPELEAMRRRIERELAAHDADELRQDETVRIDVARQAADILSAMAGYCGDLAAE